MILWNTLSAVVFQSEIAIRAESCRAMARLWQWRWSGCSGGEKIRQTGIQQCARGPWSRQRLGSSHAGNEVPENSRRKQAVMKNVGKKRSRTQATDKDVVDNSPCERDVSIGITSGNNIRKDWSTTMTKLNSWTMDTVLTGRYHTRRAHQQGSAIHSNRLSVSETCQVAADLIMSLKEVRWTAIG